MIDALPPEPAPQPPSMQCVIETSRQFRVPAVVLLGILKTEGGWAGAKIRNTNGSYDMGPMQINTIWLPELSKRLNMKEDVLQKHIINHGCFNVKIGAYILRQRIEERGNLWDGVAAYHSRTPHIGKGYLVRVQGNIRKLDQFKFR